MRLLRPQYGLAMTLLFAFSDASFAREAIAPSGSATIEIVDVPTADVVDHYGYFVSFRFGKDGNIQNKTIFGVFPRLNIGFGLDGEQILGTGDSRLNKPTLNLKFRPFDGAGIIPALAMGFDGQGYYFNKSTDEYDQREKGMYLAGTWHPFTPDFMLDLGVDAYEFDESTEVRGFTGLTYTYREMVALLFEYDNFDYYVERRINFGGKIFITPTFTVDLIGRNVAKSFHSESRETERVVRLTYTGTF
jgi:hypothetical protein